MKFWTPSQYSRGRFDPFRPFLRPATQADPCRDGSLSQTSCSREKLSTIPLIFFVFNIENYVDCKRSDFKERQSTRVVRFQCKNSPFARSGHMVQNHTWWGASSKTKAGQGGLVRVDLFWVSVQLASDHAWFFIMSCQRLINAKIHSFIVLISVTKLQSYPTWKWAVYEFYTFIISNRFPVHYTLIFSIINLPRENTYQTRSPFLCLTRLEYNGYFYEKNECLA